MRNSQAHPFLTALLCAGALLGAGCHKNGNGSSTASGPVSAGVPTTVQPPQNVQNAQSAKTAPQNELTPDPRTVDSPDPAATKPDTTAQDLAARQRQLDERQAALEARERRLEEREGQQTTVAVPEPEPESTPAAPVETRPVRVRPTPTRSTPVRSTPVRSTPVRSTPPSTVVTVPSGTRLAVELERTLSSRTSRVGESFRARVTSPVHARGVVAIPRGSEVVGVVTRAGGTRKIGGQQVLGVRFTSLVLPHGPTVPIRASFSEAGRNKAGRDTAIIGGSAAGGAIVGHNVGGGNRDHRTVIGGLLGAAIGTAVAAHTPGREVVVPRGSVVRVRLSRAVAVRVR
jgi:type IV secretory pathway VirB10-like protein